ncbi:MAG: ABC transporter substrate-binding protein [Bacteroidales bacterium]|nr:ABC transporter substrate-binding protein [Bacteroidales bacterium]
MRRLVLLGIAVILASGCVRNNNMDVGQQGLTVRSSARYASGFEVFDHEDFKLLHVYNPWQNSRDITLSYVLAEDDALIPDSLKEVPYIKTPVGRVITLSTTHVAMIHQLGKSETIKGVSGTGFIYNQEVRDRINAGEVLEVGYDQGLNYETIVSLDPDVLFIYGVESNIRATSEKLIELRIPVVFCGEYLETHPLGKAEWIRFFSLFYNMEENTDLFFNRVDSTYQSLVELAAHQEDKPKVLTGLPWKDTWYMAGGKSFAARLIEDAGGTYLWKENLSTEAIPLDLESVYARAVRADIWINPGAANTIGELNRFDERFRDLPVLLQGMVFSNNARINEMGGNDYWESGTIRPDLVLADLIGIFHPDLLTDHRYIYYRKLK